MVKLDAKHPFAAWHTQQHYQLCSDFSKYVSSLLISSKFWKKSFQFCRFFNNSSTPTPLWLKAEDVIPFFTNKVSILYSSTSLPWKPCPLKGRDRIKALKLRHSAPPAECRSRRGIAAVEELLYCGALEWVPQIAQTAPAWSPLEVNH